MSVRRSYSMHLYPATWKPGSVTRQALSRQICSETGLPFPRQNSSSAGRNRLCETSTLHCKSLASQRIEFAMSSSGQKKSSSTRQCRSEKSVPANTCTASGSEFTGVPLIKTGSPNVHETRKSVRSDSLAAAELRDCKHQNLYMSPPRGSPTRILGTGV